jgi:phosphoadenosine phosphosulfate reductase
MSREQFAPPPAVEPGPELLSRWQRARSLLAAELEQASGEGDACLTSSFQAEDVVLLALVLPLRPRIPVLFLDTGYHFAEVYAYRDALAAAWNLNLVNLLPRRTVAEQEAEHGLLYGLAPERCCALRKVEPLFAAIAGYRLWLAALRREQSRSRAALEEAADFRLPGGETVRKLSPLAEWSRRDVWQLAGHLRIPLLNLYALGYTSIGCEPCTTLPLDPSDPRSGRWAGKKTECGIHIQPAGGRGET